MATNMKKKPYFTVLKVGGTRNSKSKNFVSLTLSSYYFLMACFKTIILKHVLQKTKCLNCLFAVSLTGPLSFCVFEYYRQICKRKQSFTVAIDLT